MYRRYNLAHFILASVVALGLTMLTVCVDAQARIAFVSDRDGNPEMDIDGKNQRRLTSNHDDDQHPSWSPDGKHIKSNCVTPNLINRNGEIVKVFSGAQESKTIYESELKKWL